MTTSDSFSMTIAETRTAYQFIGDWHEGHGWPRLPLDVLPPTVALGMIGSEACAAVWAYDATPGVAWMDYMVTNPKCGIKGPVALAQLCQEFADRLAAAGKKYIHSCCRQPSLGRALERAAFQKTDEQVIHYLRVTPPPQ